MWGTKKGEWDILSFFILGAHKMRDVAQVFVLAYESVKNSYVVVFVFIVPVGTYGSIPHKLVRAIVSVIFAFWVMGLS